LANKDEYYIIYYAYTYFSTKCHLPTIDLIVAFVLFIFMLALLCFCVAAVSRFLGFSSLLDVAAQLKRSAQAALSLAINCAQ